MAYQVCPGCFMCACLLDRFINARAYDTARRGSPTTHYTPCSNITNGIISRRCCCLRLWNKRKREIWTESLPAYTQLLGRRRHCCHCCWFIVETFVLQLRTSLVAMTSALLLLLFLFVFFFPFEINDNACTVLVLLLLLLLHWECWKLERPRTPARERSTFISLLCSFQRPIIGSQKFLHCFFFI